MKTSISFTCLVCLTLWGLLFGSNFVRIEANDDLPPRPPTVTPPARDSESDDESPTLVPQVGQIYLNVSPTHGRYWSVVQWQDGQGNWHDVDGWRGDVVNGNTRWWVEENNFGKGPFRWVVYPQEGGPLLAVSQPFYLPDHSRPSLLVVVWLDSAP